jgi:hypothetical protein
MRTCEAAVFYILNVLLFPVTLIGYVIWVGKGLLAGRGSGVSATAQGPLSGRVTFFDSAVDRYFPTWRSS